MKVLKTTQKEITSLDSVTVDIDTAAAYHYTKIKRNLERYGICKLILHSHRGNEKVLEEIASYIGTIREQQNDFTGKVKVIMPKPDGRVNSGDSSSGLPFHTDGPQDMIVPSFLIFRYGRNAQAGGAGTFLDMRKVTEFFINQYGINEFMKLARRNSIRFHKEGKVHIGSILEINDANRLIFRIRLHNQGLFFLDNEVKTAWEKLVVIAEKTRIITNLPNPNEIIIFDNHRFTHGRNDILETEGERFHSRVWIDSNEELKFSPKSGIHVDKFTIAKVMNLNSLKPDIA